jgi:hypothetical protein
MLRTLTVAQCAEMLQTTEISILKMIHSGELPASNINTKKNAQRPRWRVPETDLASLLMRTRFQSPVMAQTPKKATRKATKDYFGGGDK